MAEENTWEGLENLKNAMEKVEEFEKGRFEEEIWRIKLNPEAEEFKRGKLPGKYTAKLLYGWNDGKFEEEYLKKLDKNWNRWKNDRKVGKKEYKKRFKEQMKELEGLERDKEDEQTSRIIWEDEKEVPLEAES